MARAEAGKSDGGDLGLATFEAAGNRVVTAGRGRGRFVYARCWSPSAGMGLYTLLERGAAAAAAADSLALSGYCSLPAHACQLRSRRGGMIGETTWRTGIRRIR